MTHLSSWVPCSKSFSPPKRFFGVFPKQFFTLVSQSSCGFLDKWLLLQKGFCGGFRQLYICLPSCFRKVLWRVPPTQSPPGVKVAWIVDMSHLYKSSPQKTTHHVVAVGVFFGLIFPPLPFLPKFPIEHKFPDCCGDPFWSCRIDECVGERVKGNETYVYLLCGACILIHVYVR